MIEETYNIIFPAEAHGFKLSVQFNNRLYFYPDEEFKMDMKELPPGKWMIEKVEENKKHKTVVLKKVQ